MTNDDATVGQVLAGDIDQFRALVAHYHQPLYYYIARRISRSDEAEDIVQQAFLVAYEHLESYEIGKSFRHWLWGIARNCCHRHWRRQEREARLNNRLMDMKRAELTLRRLDSEPDQSDNDAERMGAMQECIGQLRDKQRDLLDMRYAQGLPLQRMGEILNKSASAVRLVLFRLRQRLRTCVELRLSGIETS